MDRQNGKHFVVSFPAPMREYLGRYSALRGKLPRIDSAQTRIDAGQDVN